MAAGTATVTEEYFGSLKKIVFAWVSGTDDDEGTANGTTTLPYNGVVERFVSIPDTEDTPADNYDVAVLDEDGVDVLMGAGADRDAATTEQVLSSQLGAVANDKLTLSVSGAGAAKAGRAIVYLR